MAKPFHLTIMSPDRAMFDAEATYLHVPGSAGSMGILADHASLISSLKPGTFEIYRTEGAPIHFTTQKAGLVEVNRNKVSVLLDVVDAEALTAN
ncbi:MAG: F0F1 ATP synthase subunit epsilon [Candidatus Omnitrophica bacterium]|nr:F0F1 ATP synthase subunit epsilon [Candidatus Omnitrophota bacterium]